MDKTVFEQIKELNICQMAALVAELAGNNFLRSIQSCLAAERENVEGSTELFGKTEQLGEIEQFGENEQFGRRMRELRRRRRMSQKDLAKLLNTTQNAVSGYETGSREPCMQMRRQIAKSLGTTLCELECADREERDGSEEDRYALAVRWLESKEKLSVSPCWCLHTPGAANMPMDIKRYPSDWMNKGGV